MDDAFFTQIREYTGFGPVDEALLQSLLPTLPTVLDELVEDFYGAIVRDEAAKRVSSHRSQQRAPPRSIRARGSGRDRDDSAPRTQVVFARSGEPCSQQTVTIFR